MNVCTRSKIKSEMASRIKSETASQIESEMVIPIKLEMVSTKELPMTMTKIAPDNWNIYVQGHDVATLLAAIVMVSEISMTEM